VPDTRSSGDTGGQQPFTLCCGAACLPAVLVEQGHQSVKLFTTSTTPRIHLPHFCNHDSCHYPLVVQYMMMMMMMRIKIERGWLQAGWFVACQVCIHNYYGNQLGGWWCWEDRQPPVLLFGIKEIIQYVLFKQCMPQITFRSCRRESYGGSNLDVLSKCQEDGVLSSIASSYSQYVILYSTQYCTTWLLVLTRAFLTSGNILDHDSIR
jgi:hypothetical protein